MVDAVDAVDAIEDGPLPRVPGIGLRSLPETSRPGLKALSTPRDAKNPAGQILNAGNHL